MSIPGGRSSDSHIHLDPAIQAQDSPNALVATGFPVQERALALLQTLRRRQAGTVRAAALAWERAAFAEVFDHPEPGQRIRRFLEKA
ncbi:hypothetical protein GETHOR_27550 [Geothrix oryzae]|uniref:Uncharacterized protein n=1 Tax=Geothrix oryzae TaxID=2927975 RepID=A0ABM8DUD6_9BACT|nr:hypothetical protein GETHOR_27550 [Geothrix oryzae]